MMPTVMMLMKSNGVSASFRIMFALMIVTMMTTTAVEATICACSTRPKF